MFSDIRTHPVVLFFCASNPGTKTIERDLLEALAKAKAFPEDMKLDVGKVHENTCV